MGRAVATLKAAVVGNNMSLARRQLGELIDEADHDGALDVLAQVAAGGSPLAMELLIEALDRFGTARHAVRRFLVDETAVDDVTQDTLVTVARSIAGFRGDAAFTAWLGQIARSRANDHLRRVRAADPLGDPLGEPGSAPSPAPGTAAHVSSLIASRPDVRLLLGELPERYRDAITLRDVEGLPYPEVATRLGRNLTAAKSHVARGRALLAARLAAQGQDQDP